MSPASSTSQRRGGKALPKALYSLSASVLKSAKSKCRAARVTVASCVPERAEAVICLETLTSGKAERAKHRVKVCCV